MADEKVIELWTRRAAVREIREHNEFLDDLVCKGRSQNTVDCYTRHLREWAWWALHHPCNSVVPASEDVSEWQKSLHRMGNSAATINLKVAAVKAYAVYAGVELAVSPVQGARRVPDPLTQREQSAVFAVLDKMRSADSHHARRARASILFLLYTGLRASEAVSVKSTDVDWEAGTVKVLGKGAKERLVSMRPVWPQMAEWHSRHRPALIDRYGAEPHDYLLVAGRGKPMGYRYLYDLCMGVGARAGIVSMPPHRLRRTYATIASESGVDITVICKALGHADIRTTYRYIGVDVDSLHEMGEALAVGYSRVQAPQHAKPGMVRGW